MKISTQVAEEPLLHRSLQIPLMAVSGMVCRYFSEYSRLVIVHFRVRCYDRYSGFSQPQDICCNMLTAKPEQTVQHGHQ